MTQAEGAERYADAIAAVAARMDDLRHTRNALQFVAETHAVIANLIEQALGGRPIDGATIEAACVDLYAATFPTEAGRFPPGVCLSDPDLYRTR